MEQSTCSEHGLLRDVDRKVDEVIQGLYGKLNEPQTGFIHKITLSLEKIENFLEDHQKRITCLEKEKENKIKEKKENLRSLGLSVFSAVLSLLTAIALLLIKNG